MKLLSGYHCPRWEMQGLLLLVLLVCSCLPVCADQFFSSERIRPTNRPIPITELRMVREPGNYHFTQANDGEYILSDYWWREVKVGERRYSGGPSGPGPGPAPAPDPYPGAGRRKVFVEIVGGRGYEFFGRERVKPTSFTLLEDLPRNVPIRYGNSRGTLVAVFDGYHVDMGLDQAARVVPGYNGVMQNLGNGQGLQDVAVVVYWEEDDRGEALTYRDQTAPESEAWGMSLKSKVQSKQPSAPPAQGASPSAPAAPSAAPEVKP